MPQYDLNNITCAPYSYADDTVTYGALMPMGEAMTANLELRFAEGRLYAEGGLAEYLKKVVGGTVSVGIKYIPDETQKSLFGLAEKVRTINTTQARSLSANKKMTAKYHGVGMIAPDMVDGVEKFTAVFVHKALFGPPSMSYKTVDNTTITFNTPTTTGEFLKSDAADGDIVEWGIFATEDEAKAWINACYGKSS